MEKVAKAEGMFWELDSWIRDPRADSRGVTLETRRPVETLNHILRTEFARSVARISVFDCAAQSPQCRRCTQFASLSDNTVLVRGAAKEQFVPKTVVPRRFSRMLAFG